MGRIFLFIFLLPSICFAATDSDTYLLIDNYALSIPEKSYSNLEELTSQLIKQAKNDREKLRSIFVWIAHNIQYDKELSEKDKRYFDDVSPVKTFQRKRTVCSGYSLLAEKMMSDALGRKVYYVGGNSKGYGVELHSHAWNAVELEGKWYFIDCTWGAGYLDSEKDFIKEFNDFYFLTPPELFIYTHLPDDSKWQRLEKPITKEEFTDLVKITPNYFKYSINMISHNKSVIEADSALSIKLVSQEDILFTSTLDDLESKYFDRYVFTQKKSNSWEVNVLFPKPGAHRVRIYGKPKGQEGSYPEILSYAVSVNKIGNGEVGFPETFQRFRENGCYLYCPMTAFLNEFSKHFIKISIPNAVRAAVVQGKNWQYLSRDDNEFYSYLKLRPGLATVYAIFKGESQFSGLIQYKVEGLY